MSKAPSWQVPAFCCLSCTKSSAMGQRRANVLEKGNPAWLDGDTWLYCHLFSCSRRESIILACPHTPTTHLLLCSASREVCFSCIKHWLLIIADFCGVHVLLRNELHFIVPFPIWRQCRTLNNTAVTHTGSVMVITSATCPHSPSQFGSNFFFVNSAAWDGASDCCTREVEWRTLRGSSKAPLASTVWVTGINKKLSKPHLLCLSSESIYAHFACKLCSFSFAIHLSVPSSSWTLQVCYSLSAQAHLRYNKQLHLTWNFSQLNEM